MIKAVTVWQPWASAIAAGLKVYETRVWKPGPSHLEVGEELAIHAGMRAVAAPPDVEAYLASLPRPLPRPLGAVVCVCRVIGFQPTDDLVAAGSLSATELLLGNYSPGRWAWQLEVLRRFPSGIQALGHQGIWNWWGEQQGVAAMGGWWRCAACGMWWAGDETQCPTCGGHEIGRDL